MTQPSQLSATNRSLNWRQRVDIWRRRLWWLATLLILLVAVYVVVARELMGLVAGFRPQLEEMLEQRLGTPVTIVALEGRMEGLSPVFEMRGLRLEPQDDALAPVHIRRSELTVDLLSSLVHRSLRARQLLVEGVRLAVVRQDDGRIVLRGLEALTRSEGTTDMRPLLELLYRQKRLVVNELDLTLEWPGTPSLQFPDVELALVSSGERHLFSARASSSTEPMELDLRLHMDRDAFQLSEVSGEGYARIEGGGFAPWLAPLLAQQPVSVSRLAGRMEIWGRLGRGQLKTARLKLGLAAMELAGDWFQAPWHLDRSDMLLSLRRRGEGYQLFMPEAELQDADGTLMLPQLMLQWGQAEAGMPRPWALQVMDLELAPLHRWAARQPVKWQPAQQALIDRLAEFQPGGTIAQLDVSGEGARVGGFAARFQDIGLSAVGKVPGVSGLAGWASGSPDQGVAHLDSRRVEVALPNLYDNTLAGKLDGALGWRRSAEATEVRTGWLRVTNPDARGRMLATVRLRPDAVPELSLLASLADGRGDNVAHYIPLRRLPDAAASWLSTAFNGGTVPEGRILHEGPVRIDPNRQQDRTLQLAFRARGLTLNYLPGWPDLEQVNGDVILDGRAIRGRNIDARLGKTRLTGVSADIPEYENEAVPTLVVSGRVDGEAADVTTILHDTPLKDALPAEVARWSLTRGQVSGHLLLHWPLPADAPGKVFIASAGLTEAELTSADRNLSFTGVNGPVYFHLDRGLFSSGLSGKFWDGEFQSAVATADGQLAVTGQGDAAVEQAMTWMGQSSQGVAAGRFNYQAALILPWRTEGDSFLELSSDLTGVSLMMPPPLAKAEADPVNMRVRVDLLEDTLVSLYADPLLRGRVQMAATGIAAADLVFGDREPVLPESGIRLRGDLPALSVEPWMDWLDSRPERAGDLQLRAVNLMVAKLDMLDFPVTAARLKARPEQRAWRFDVEGEELAGSLLLPEGFQLRGNRPLEIDIRRLVMNDDDDKASSLDPMALPVADITASGLVVDGEDFGQWKMKWRPRQDGLSLEDIDANWRAGRFTGDARWLVSGERESTHYTGRVETTDLAAALLAWEVPTLIRSKRAAAVIDLEWAGSPLDIDYRATQGTVSVHVREALIPNSNTRTNALRMLGFFNVNAVSRRLRLDFSDVYKKGLSCDEISGDFTVEGPLVTTRNLVIDSPSAEFRISGTTDLETEQLQQRVDVTLPTSSSLYLGCFAGPAACAGIFVVERLWGNKLEKMLTLSYSVTGYWSDPKVKEMERDK